MEKELDALGSIRVKYSDLNFYEKSKHGWILSKKDFPHVRELIRLFKSHKNIKLLRDTKNSEFLKGSILHDGKIVGARINILPNGKVVDKAYSIFAKNLTIHDETSHSHWDVMFQNPGGTYCHLYTLEKKSSKAKEKYRKVDLFGKKYKLLNRNLMKALYDKEDEYAIPMYTLLKTYMRVGNETYYNANGHKGLTTITKKDISIKGDTVTFNYLAKNGVPMTIRENFPSAYIKRIKDRLKKIKEGSFVFANHDGSPLKDTYFMQAFEKYCGEKFYPHIVRSYYATKTANEFIKAHKSATKKEVNQLFDSIAEKLGHKRFDKKQNQWKDSHSVTVHYYLDPKTFQRVNNLIK